MLRRVASSAAVVVATLSLIASSGCFTPTECDPTKDPRCGGGGGDLYRPLTTPYAPLYNLALTYKLRGQEAADVYATLFDPTLYQFIWDDPNEPGLDNYYGYTEEMKFRSMFTDPNVTSVTLTFLANASDSVGVPSNTVGDPAGTLRFTVNGISLQLDLSGTSYQTNGTGEYYVAPTDSVNGVPVEYKIIRWRDRTAPPAAAPSLQHAQWSTTAAGSALMRAAALADEKARKERLDVRSSS